MLSSLPHPSLNYVHMATKRGHLFVRCLNRCYNMLNSCAKVHAGYLATTTRHIPGIAYRQHRSECVPLHELPIATDIENFSGNLLFWTLACILQKNLRAKLLGISHTDIPLDAQISCTPVIRQQARPAEGTQLHGDETWPQNLWGNAPLLILRISRLLYL